LTHSNPILDQRRRGLFRRIPPIAMTVAFAVTLSSSNVAAISTYTSTSLTCGSIKSIILKEGAANFRHTSKRTGNVLYNRYVRNSNYCNVNQTTTPDYIPASDTKNCRVFYCIKRETNCDPWRRSC
jgi:hypothetical protein